ncbi:MAG: pyruvate kinase [Clostridia bacterium]|nr:pyruvate kinase [Clostridia bacterium]
MERMSRKTKIICTIGPASETEETLRAMMDAGMDVARINFSHGAYADHLEKINRIKKLRAEKGLAVSLLLDTKGPEVRLGTFADGRVTLEAGASFTLCMYDTEGDASHVSITYRDLWKDITIGTRILIDDGNLELAAEHVDQREIACRVLHGGEVSNRKGVNLPGVQLSMPFLSDKDRADIKFGVENDFDFIAASFTQCADDILQIRRALEENGCTKDIRIIAKIENAAGVANMDEILSVADGVMVARGDMGVEIPMEDIPVIQKTLITKCYNSGKQVITATQMLESMTHSPRPTRAEITDVANAIYDGTSAIMLSGETAAGQYPVEAVAMMAKIATRTESDIDYRRRFAERGPEIFSGVTGAISHATCTTAHDLNAAAIITVTKSGSTARMISKYRPETPIIGCATTEKVCRHMNLSWGITPLLIDEMDNTDDLFRHAVEKAFACGLVKDGDLVVITAGIPIGISGTTNMLKVQIVGDVLTSGTGLVDRKICGNLCVCKNEQEALASFRDGEILVIPETTNRLLPLLRHAAGIICEAPGIDSHAAIAGMTLDIPVIVGALGATKILKSGTAVTVDGKRGLVFTGNTDPDGDSSLTRT